MSQGCDSSHNTRQQSAAAVSSSSQRRVHPPCLPECGNFCNSTLPPAVYSLTTSTVCSAPPPSSQLRQRTSSCADIVGQSGLPQLSRISTMLAISSFSSQIGEKGSFFSHAMASARRSSRRVLTRPSAFAGRTVVQLVIVLTTNKASTPTDKHTGVHVGCASGCDYGHVVTVHVDQPTDVYGAVDSGEGVFAPRIEHLTVDQSGLVEEGRPGPAGAILKGDDDAATWSKRLHDQRRLDIDPGALLAPDQENEILARCIDKRIGMRSIRPYPNTSRINLFHSHSHRFKLALLGAGESSLRCSECSYQ